MVFSKLGHCPKCMRTSFAAAAAGWALSMVAPTIIATFAMAGAALLTALWLAHLVAFAWKVTTMKHAAPTHDQPASPTATLLSRRAFVPLFLRTLAFAAVVTVAPRAITSALGQNRGPCDSCSRYKGSATCWTCCSCQNSNCITGCKTTSGGDPNKYNTCIGNCTTTFGNCQKACQ
jgi:hypothetical protein